MLKQAEKSLLFFIAETAATITFATVGALW